MYRHPVLQTNVPAFTIQTSEDIQRNEMFKFKFTRLMTALFFRLEVGLTIQSEGALCSAQRVRGHAVVRADV
jgi:hypothetical protein